MLRTPEGTEAAEIRPLSACRPGRHAQVVAVGVRDPEIPQPPGPLLQGLEDRVARDRDAVAPPLHVVHLDDDLHPQAPSEGRYVPTEVAALLGQLGNRAYAQDDAPGGGWR